MAILTRSVETYQTSTEDNYCRSKGVLVDSPILILTDVLLILTDDHRTVYWNHVYSDTCLVLYIYLHT